MNKSRTGGIICELLAYKKPSTAEMAMEGKSILLDRGTGKTTGSARHLLLRRRPRPGPT